MDEDAYIRQAAQERIMSHKQWEDKQRFRQQTRGNSYAGGSSGASCQRQQSDVELRLRSTNVNLARSKSMEQPKIN